MIHTTLMRNGADKGIGRGGETIQENIMLLLYVLFADPEITLFVLLGSTRLSAPPISRK